MQDVGRLDDIDIHAGYISNQHSFYYFADGDGERVLYALYGPLKSWSGILTRVLWYVLSSPAASGARRVQGSQNFRAGIYQQPVFHKPRLPALEIF